MVELFFNNTSTRTTTIFCSLFSLFCFLGYQVFNKKQYWSWVRNVFLSGVFAGKWYNGRPENQTMYIGNKRSVLVGMARGRQLRVQPGEFGHFFEN